MVWLVNPGRPRLIAPLLLHRRKRQIRRQIKKEKSQGEREDEKMRNCWEGSGKEGGEGREGASKRASEKGRERETRRARERRGEDENGLR